MERFCEDLRGSVAVIVRNRPSIVNFSGLLGTTWMAFYWLLYSWRGLWPQPKTLTTDFTDGTE